MKNTVIGFAILASLWPTTIVLAQRSTFGFTKSALYEDTNRSSAGQLRKQYEAVERATREIAAKLHRAKKNSSEKQGTDLVEMLEIELRDKVAIGFELRQQLHEVELAQLEEKLNQARQTIHRRHQIRQQIIDRRIEDLLNPNLLWDAEPQGAAQSVNPDVSLDPFVGKSSSLAQTVRFELARREEMRKRLQGTWVLDRTKNDPQPRTLSIDKTTWVFSDGEESESGIVSLDSKGSGRLVVNLPRESWMGDYELGDGTLAIHFKSGNSSSFRGYGAPPAAAAQVSLEEKLWSWSGVYRRLRNDNNTTR